MESNIGEIMEKDGKGYLIVSFSLNLHAPAEAVEVVGGKLVGEIVKIPDLMEYSRKPVRHLEKAELLSQFWDRNA